MTPFQLHVLDWKDCTACSYGDKRHRIALFRGDVPCDVLLIGEAPGEAENAKGWPFYGPAGHLLEKIVRAAVPNDWEARDVIRQKLSANGGFVPAELDLYQEETDKTWIGVGYSNLVACFPRNEGSSKKATEPDGESIEACAPRLKELVTITSPKLIVCVGSLAEKWIGDSSRGLKHRIKFDREIPTTTIHHPAFILRSPFVQQGLLRQRATVILSEAVEKYVINPTPAVPEDIPF